MDTENPTTLQREKSVLLRRSTRAFSDKQPQEGVMGTIATVCCSLVFSLIILAICNAISIACVVIGAIYLDKDYCPAQKNIAPVLIASGVLAIFLSIFEGRSKIRIATDGEEVEEPKDCCYFFLQIVRFAKLTLFIYLSILVFSLYSHVKYEVYTPTNPDDPNYYCHPTLFIFAFWTILFVFICLGLGIIFCCCCCCMTALVVSVNK